MTQRRSDEKLKQLEQKTGEKVYLTLELFREAS